MTEKKPYVSRLRQGMRRALQGLQLQKGGEISSETSRYEDQPIIRLGDDKFGFQDYADVLTKRVVEAEPPLVIGVFGSWGSGKSSLMHLVDVAVQREHKKTIRSIWINVWELSTQEDVWQAFLQALFSQINTRLTWWQKPDWSKLFKSLLLNSYRILLVAVPAVIGMLIGKENATWQDVLEWQTLNPFSSDVSTGSGMLISYGLAIWTILKPAVEAAKGVVSFDLKSVLKVGSYEAQISALVQLKSKFENWVQLLVGQEGRLVIFIDDLDRCTSDKIPDILEAIKLFTGSQQCVYVIGLDRDVVRNGVKQKYDFEDTDQADAYLEKIFQVPFHLPPIEKYHIRRYIEAYQDVEEISPDAKYIFAFGLEPNPRKIKRALNIYRILWDLAEMRWQNWELAARVNPNLLAKMVVIQESYRTLYQFLTRQPRFLIQLQKGLPTESQLEGQDVQPEWREFFAKKEFDDAFYTLMKDLLSIGGVGFGETGDLLEPEDYIFLTSATEGTLEIVVLPRRDERDILLGNNQAAIDQKIQEILARAQRDPTLEEAIHKEYIQRLQAVVFNRQRHTADERLAADYSIDRFDGLARQNFEPKTILIPAGEFLMGSVKENRNQEQLIQLGKVSGLVAQGDNISQGEVMENSVFDQSAKDDETPQHLLYLPAYRIGRYPVTNREYQYFIHETGHAPPKHWRRSQFSVDRQHYPVVYVSWHDAIEYCRWLSQKTNLNYRLPSEAEWEKAARGTGGWIYPWGNTFNAELANTKESNRGNISSVYDYPDGRSPYGCLNMAGNIWEWTRSIYGKLDSMKSGFIEINEYPYKLNDGREDIEKDIEWGRVLRGGAFNNAFEYARCASRHRFLPSSQGYSIGFRVAVSLS